MLKILLAYDGSAHARAAVELLKALPLAGRAAVTVVMVSDVPDLSHRGYVVVPGMRELLQQVRQEERAEAQARAGLACGSLGAVGIECAARGECGKPAEVLLRLAREIGADLTVVGARGLTGAKETLLGHVAREVVRRAPSSVLVVKPAAV